MFVVKDSSSTCLTAASEVLSKAVEVRNSFCVILNLNVCSS